MVWEDHVKAVEVSDKIYAPIQVIKSDFNHLESSSSQWHMLLSSQNTGRLCQGCWSYWKKYGDFKYPSRSG